MAKILYVMRGLPGSGKSTTARRLGQGGAIFSTDEYFLDDEGKYRFDATLLPEAHRWNEERAVEAMRRGVSPVVIDNTNVKAASAKPYVEAARALGYEVRIAEPDAPWWKKFKPNMTEQEKQGFAEELSKRNLHDVRRWVMDPKPDEVCGTDSARADRKPLLIVESELEREDAERARIVSEYLAEISAQEESLLKELAHERFRG